MTTLPTTSSIRLPRSGGPGGQVLAMPSTQVSPIAIPASQVALTPADMWRVLRGNIWLIVVSLIVSVSGGVGLYFFFKQVDPKFMSVGNIQVNRPTRTNPTDGSANDVSGTDFNLSIEQRTQASMLVHPSLWDEVLEKNTNVRRLKWFAQFETESKKTNGEFTAIRLAKDDLTRNFAATPRTDTKLVSVSMQAASPDDARDIVQYIVDTHIQKQQQQTFDRTNTELETAKQWRERYVRLMSQTKDRMNGLQADLSSAGSMTAQSRLSIKEMQISALIGEQARSRLAAAEAAAQLDSIQQQTNEGKDPFQVDIFVRNDSTVLYLTRQVDEYDMLIQTAEQVQGPKARQVTDLRTRRDIARTKLEKATGDARATARTQLVESAKSALSSKKAEAESIEARVDSLRNELGEISSKYADFASLQDEYTGYRELEREMNERIAVLQNALRQQVASVSWSNAPTRPDELAWPSLKMFLPASIVIGLAFSVGIAFLREMMDQSVRSPRDISRVGPMNLLGMISSDVDDPQLAGVPLHVVISQAPHSMLAEQFRQVRTRLQHAASLDTTRTIVITSPGPQDGKSTVACNLAAGLALNGRRILLVDANFRRPELHKLFGTPNEVGFANVLDSVSNLESAVQKTPIPNLELLPTGAKPANPTELIESQLFSDFIDRALEEYDHVIFDAGPLLVVSEAVALAPRVDGVITVVRAKKNTRGMLSRVRDTLKQIKAEHLGVVLNGVRTWGGGYYARNIKTYYAYQNVD